VPLGEAGNTSRLQLDATGASFSDARASAAVNSLGLLDLVQIAARGLAPKTQYQVYLATSNREPFGQLTPLAVLKTNPDGAGIVQAIGPMKALTAEISSGSRSSRRFLIVTEMKDPTKVVLRQSNVSNSP
jgi:hypothetical protein